MSSIARTLGVSLSTVSRALARAGLSRLADLDPPPPPNRYERGTPGELLHIDIKRLGGIRGVATASPVTAGIARAAYPMT